ncbi:glycosyltransferase family 2 protein [Flavobacterium fluviale]|uniref:Glycosyltransferase family 2 protein n=1 Tax=Flavobacterium fluviale TaxID=2249356 RepID=A0A344LN82_9FLAO|nr:glycosyltransferase family 2 protein [Flavobacterium fluviale]AXB55374.1 glycosyltransferase family 2 protein [Flavobacterium fluviale]
MNDNKITASIVLYLNDINILSKAIKSLLKTNSISKLILVDNSPTNELKIIVEGERILYFHNPANPGFGAAHNVAIQKSIDLGSKYHFIVNPDIYFENDVVESMIQHMDNDESIGMMMPQILNEDGSIQNLPKLLPSPTSILMRKIKMPKQKYEKFISKYELRCVPRDFTYNTPILSGCFTLLNLKAISKVGMYDDRFFMYFEDWDLSRRIHKHFKTIYFPKVSVYHDYESGANKSKRLFKIFVRSAIIYFNKWGWFFDLERKKINDQALSQFK